MMYFKSNSLARAKYNPSFKLTDRKIFEIAIFLFQNEKSNLTKKEYEELCGKTVSTTTLKSAVERLKEITFTIEGEVGINNALIFEEISYNRGKIDFKFSEEIKAHISFWSLLEKSIYKAVQKTTKLNS